MLSERLRQAMDDAGVSQADLARACGVKPPSVHGWLSGKAKFLRGENLLTAARVLRVSQDWLATGKGPKEPQNLPRMALGGISPSPSPIEMLDNPEYPAVRRVSVKAQAGVTGYAVEDVTDCAPIVFRGDWYKMHNYRPDRLMALRVAGESMVPTLWPNDLIVVNTESSKPKDGHAYLVAYYGEVLVKRLVMDAGTWWLCSDNADQRRYPRKQCDDSTTIVGEVIYKQSERI